MSYVQEGTLSHLSKEQIKTEMIIHSDMKERVNKMFSDTVAFGERFIDWLKSPLIAKEDTTADSSTPAEKLNCQPVEECLAEVKERKVEWEEMWEDRLKKLEKLADGGVPVHSSTEVSLIYAIKP